MVLNKTAGGTFFKTDVRFEYAQEYKQEVGSFLGVLGVVNFVLLSDKGLLSGALDRLR